MKDWMAPHAFVAALCLAAGGAHAGNRMKVFVDRGLLRT